MLYYDRIDISEGIDNTKRNRSKECMICHYWCFDHGFKFQDSVSNGCHDLTTLSVNISNISIITIKNVDYRCIILNISKSKAINLLESARRSSIYIKNIILLFSLLKRVFLRVLF